MIPTGHGEGEDDVGDHEEDEVRREKITKRV